MGKSLESRIVDIEERNSRVETDKKWETSLTRRFSIAFLTYVVVLVYLFAIGNNNPWLNALIPAIGYFMSTLVIKSVRKIWQEQSAK